VLGLGRTAAYRLVAAGDFPVPVVRAGGRLIVPVAPLLRLLGLPAAAVPADGLDVAGGASVDTWTGPADSPPRRTTSADFEHDGGDT
jgi:hypothetical protein